MKILKYIGIIVVIFLMSLVTSFTTFYWINTYFTVDAVVKNLDSLSLANTFMVFVTFLVVIATILITIVGIFYTNWFSRQKEIILRDNMDDLIEAILQKDNLKDEIWKNLLTKPNIDDMIRDAYSKHNDEFKKDFKKDFDDMKKKHKEDIEELSKRLGSISSVEETKNSEDIQKILDKLKGASQ